MVEVSINLKVELDDEFFDDIICTMFEGGSNYWIDFIKIDHPDGKKPQGIPNSTWASGALNKGGSIFISPLEEKEVKYKLTKQILIAGIQMWVDERPDSICTTHQNKKITIDAGDIDADDADMILQYSIFKEVVFG